MGAHRAIRLATLVALLLTPACAARGVPVATQAVADSQPPARMIESGVSRQGGVVSTPQFDGGARPVTARTTLETAEKWDPELKLALVQLEATQTVQRHLDVADAYRRLGIADKAVDHLTRALQVDRGSAAAYDRLARVWRDAGLPQLGLADGYRAAYYAPMSPEAQNTLGTILQTLGMFRAARERYRMALRLDPGAAYALNNLCTLDLLDGNPARAVADCGQALEMAPGLVVARQNLARAEAMLALGRAGSPDARH